MALDPGRYTSVVCFYRCDPRHTLFRTIETTPDVVRELCVEKKLAEAQLLKELATRGYDPAAQSDEPVYEMPHT
jgi:hypothetical protein